MLQFLKKTLLVSALMLVVVGCQKDNKNTLEVSRTQIDVSGDGEVKLFSVISNTKWTVSSDADWIKIDPMEGEGNRSVKLEVAETAGNDGRSVVLKVTAAGKQEKVEVVQKGREVILSHRKIKFGWEEQSEVLEIRTKHAWVLKKTAALDWCKFDKLYGEGDAQVTIQVEENLKSTSNGPSKLFISADGQDFEVELSQEPGLGQLTLDKETVEFKWQGGEEYFVINTRHVWELENAESIDWCEFDKTSGEGLAYVKVTAQENNSPERRTPAELKIKANKRYYTLKLEQRSRSFGEGEVRVVKAATQEGAKPIQIVIMGDGFLEEDYDEGGAFDQAANKAVEAFFDIEPYKTYKDYFNVSSVVAYSEERGATILSPVSDQIPAVTKNTAFGSTLEGGRSTGVSANYTKIKEYAAKVPEVRDEGIVDKVAIILIVNVKVYAGTCAMYRSGGSISMCPMSLSFGSIVKHEAGGHGYGFLLDEYVYYNENYPSSLKASVELWRAGDNWKIGANITFETDMDDVHWKHYVGVAPYNYSNELKHEGADLYAYGVWRPEKYSCMINNISYFNAPSREGIVRKIMRDAGKEFSWEEFKNKDVHKPPVPTSFKSMIYDESSRPLGEPVFIDE